MFRRGLQILIGAVLIAFAPMAFALDVHDRAAGPKRVLLINSFGRHFEPFSSAAASFRTELASQSPEPIEFYEVALETARFAEGGIDEPLAEYLRVLFEQKPPDLVVPIAAPAVRFCARHRATLFSDVPILAAAAEERHLAAIDLGANAAAVTFRLDLAELIEDVLHLLPATTNIFVVLGASPLERYWASETRRAWDAFSGRVAFTWLNDLTFPRMLERVASLPPQSAIVFVMMDVDAAGVPYEQYVALEGLHEVSNAPIFGIFEEQVGRGVVGGRGLQMHRMGAEAAHAALRMLNGESDLPTVAIASGTPVYDWRELERWHIGEAQQLPGADVRYRRPTFWQANKWRIAAVGAFVAVETLLIGFLLTNRLRLRSAQSAQRQSASEAKELRRELSHMDRVTLLSQFTTSLAHELGQPLGAILRNADAAEIFLKSVSPDLDEVRAIVSDIRRDGVRAGNVIDRLRAMLRRREIEMQPLEWGTLVGEVGSIVHSDATGRGIALEIDANGGLPAVHGDRVHLQQVLLNLVVNAMDVLDNAGSSDRRVTVRTRLVGDDRIECSVADTGPGIAREKLDEIFDPFVTTKSTGMGMGLPISRAIIEAHGGHIWAENSSGGGAVFRFSIPTSPREGT